MTALALLAAGIVLFIWRGNRSMADFTVNYKAGDRILHGETLYRVQDEHYQFKYSPYCALIYLPLALLPLPRPRPSGSPWSSSRSRPS